MKINIFDIFCWGIDYGQLIQEQERDNEDLFDGFQGMIVSRKFSMPSQTVQRRKPHSEKWRQAKKNSYKEFIKLCAQLGKDEFEI